MRKPEKVNGEKRKKVLIYTLSTCVWCKMTKTLLNNMGIAYEYIDVDVLEEEEKKKVMKEVKKWNPKCSFPTMVIDDETVILGYDENQIREALKP